MITETDVLVVGAGPAGLATALTALRHGARVLVVERRPTTSTIPRATGVSTRTMEIVRAWGLTEAVRAGSVECVPQIEVTPALAGEPSEVVPSRYPSMRDALAVSPAFPVLCPQDHIEPVLAVEVRRLGGEIRFGTPLTGLRVDHDGVHADLGAAGAVRARFVVGADGPRSTVRSALGIGCEHLGTLGEFTQVLFRPDLAVRLGRHPPILAFVEQSDASGVLLPVGDGRWSFVQQSSPERGPVDATSAGWTAVLRAATGMADLEPEILGAQRFTMTADVATAFRAGPGFLAGDAAHRTTPLGGIGMNTAVHDGHELGWRLAWACRGLVGDPLLDSYGAERGPVGRAGAERSLRDGRDPSDGLPGDLGGTYRSAVISDDGDAPAAGHQRTARPGERAPHAWVQHHGRRCSVLDLFEDRLTVIAAGRGWQRAARRLAGPPMEVLDVGQDPSEAGAMSRAYRLDADSAVLVRPDGVVAWRHDGPCADHARTLATAVTTALGRSASRLPVAV